MLPQMIKPRKEELHRLNEQQAKDQAIAHAALPRTGERQRKNDPLPEERAADQNRLLGAIARIRTSDDTALSHKFVQQAAKAYGGEGDGRARRYLERVIGKIPVNAK